jgi:glycosyltransferase involved in cell wall biosynthesis
MKLIINGGNGFLPKENNFECFIHHKLYRLCGLHTTDSFVFLSCGNHPSLPGNGLSVSLKAPLLAKPVSRIWRNRRVVSVVKKSGADILISLNGRPLPVQIHQVLVISEGTGRQAIKSAADYLHAGKQCHIITSSGSMKQRLLKEGIAASAVLVLPRSPASLYQPVDWEKREAVRHKYTEGKEYFLMPVSSTPHQHILNVLKAFSRFKKWQQSNMQLMIPGNIAGHKKMQELLQTYKYRNDVKIMDDPADTEYADILASCMAMIYLPADGGTAIVPAEALQCGVPVITTATGVLAEMAGDAVLYCEPTDIEKLAGDMVKLYKDEKFRHALGSRAKERSLSFGEETAMERLWDYMQQAVTT